MLSETADKEGFATFFLARLAISTDLNSSSHLGPFTLGYLIARDNWRVKNRTHPFHFRHLQFMKFV